MENGVGDFDLSSDCPTGYFKSSFARSMAFNSSAQSKSLDYVYMDEGATISEEEEPAPKPPALPAAEPPPIRRPFTPRRSVPTIPTYELQREFSLRASRVRTNDAMKFWKMKQESLKTTTNGESPNSLWADSRGDHHHQHIHQEESKEDEINRLRKECQGLMEANRKLQHTSASIDQSLLQAQIDTLQWQLKQAESNRQMYRAVMEQVSKFLERVHKTLEASAKAQSRSKARVPRSRSVHTVAQSRASSPSGSVHRANSISQIQDSYSAFRDYACRASRAAAEDIAPERLSQEAFRLLRTVQSLLGTREPDLARVSSSDTETTERRDSTSMGSCSSLLQSSSSREPEELKPPSGGPATPQLSVGSAEDESGFSSMSSFHEVGLPGGQAADSPDHRSGVTDTRPAVSDHRSGVSDTRSAVSDHRSGISDSRSAVSDHRSGVSDSRSAVSDHRSGLSDSRSSVSGGGSFHELGLPVVDSPTASNRHRRWSSTPVDHPATYPQREALRVLWQQDPRGSGKLCLQNGKYYTNNQNCIF